VKELTQERRRIVRQSRFVERAIHQCNPSIPRRFVDRKRRMTHPQTWMPALLDVPWRAAEAPDQEIA
jgi:hypothetical protein